jgi:hypothetical protein
MIDVTTMKLSGGAVAYMVGAQTPSKVCNCGEPVMVGENGCDACMTHNGQLVFLLRHRQWDRCLELQKKANRELFVILNGHTLSLIVCVQEGRKLQSQ